MSDFNLGDIEYYHHDNEPSDYEIKQRKAKDKLIYDAMLSGKLSKLTMEEVIPKYDLMLMGRMKK